MATQDQNMAQKFRIHFDVLQCKREIMAFSAFFLSFTYTPTVSVCRPIFSLLCFFVAFRITAVLSFSLITSHF